MKSPQNFLSGENRKLVRFATREGPALRRGGGEAQGIQIALELTSLRLRDLPQSKTNTILPSDTDSCFLHMFIPHPKFL